jgi:translation initiation factor IF-2
MTTEKTVNVKANEVNEGDIAKIYGGLEYVSSVYKNSEKVIIRIKHDTQWVTVNPDDLIEVLTPQSKNEMLKS